MVPIEYKMKSGSEQFSMIQPAVCNIYLQIYKLLITPTHNQLTGFRPNLS